jgi:hypothetical protein
MPTTSPVGQPKEDTHCRPPGDAVQETEREQAGDEDEGLPDATGETTRLSRPDDGLHEQGGQGERYTVQGTPGRADAQAVRATPPDGAPQQAIHRG